MDTGEEGGTMIAEHLILVVGMSLVVGFISILILWFVILFRVQKFVFKHLERKDEE